jgi:hypothetical protein
MEVGNKQGSVHFFQFFVETKESPVFPFPAVWMSIVKKKVE